jgi:hypothetical protein
MTIAPGDDKVSTNIERVAAEHLGGGGILW